MHLGEASQELPQSQYLAWPVVLPVLHHKRRWQAGRAQQACLEVQASYPCCQVHQALVAGHKELEEQRGLHHKGHHRGHQQRLRWLGT